MAGGGSASWLPRDVEKKKAEAGTPRNGSSLGLRFRVCLRVWAGSHVYLKALGVLADCCAGSLSGKVRRMLCIDSHIH